MEDNKKKVLKETWDGENVIDDLVDRAKGYMDEGEDIDDAIMGAIDTGLIYTKDIRDLAIHYDTMPEDSELIEGFIEDLMSDMYNELSDYEPEVENDDEETDESLNEYYDDEDEFNPFKDIVKELKGNKLDTPMKKEMTLEFAKLIANRIKENEGSFNDSDDEYEVLNSVCYSIEDYEPSPTLLAKFTKVLTGYSLTRGEIEKLLEILYDAED